DRSGRTMRCSADAPPNGLSRRIMADTPASFGRFLHQVHNADHLFERKHEGKPFSRGVQFGRLLDGLQNRILQISGNDGQDDLLFWLDLNAENPLLLVAPDAAAE